MTDREAMLPRLVTHESLPDVYDPMGNHGTGGDGYRYANDGGGGKYDDSDYDYIPLMAIR